MRRLALVFVALLSLPLTSCLVPNAWDDTPPARRRPPYGPATPCREVARIHCDTERCKGVNMDWVELICGNERVNRCVATKGCIPEK